MGNKTDKIRVLFISQYSGLGGAQRSMINLICGLRSLGVESTVLIPKHGIAEEEFKRHGISYRVVRYASMRVFSHGKFRNKIEYIVRRTLNFIQSKRYKRIFNNHFDIIHANSSLVFWGHDLKRELAIPLVWHLREYGDTDYKMEYLYNKDLTAQKFKIADRIITISDAMTRHYKQSVSAEANYFRIYNEVENSGFDVSNQSTDSVKICIVGGVFPSKNQVECIKALSIINDMNYHLDLIGNCSDTYKTELLEIARQGKIEDKISFLGERRDIPKLLCQYDIGVIPSVNEGFGRVTVEYMISGLAVIASDTGANPELVHDNETGLLYRLGDIQMLADRLKQLIEDRNRRIELADKGRGFALESFCSGKNIGLVYSLYKELTSSK